MTIAVGLNTGAEILFLADCRLSYENPRTGCVTVGQDVCQKLFVPNRWSVVGFSGHLCIARDLMNGMSRLLAKTPRDDPRWLRDDDKVKTHLRVGLDLHAKRHRGHRECLRQGAELLVAWVDRTQTYFGEPRAVNDLSAPPRMELLSIRSPSLEIRRQPFGPSMIGSGAAISENMRREAYLKIAWFGREEPHGYLPRLFFAAAITDDLLRAANIPTVGGLLQMAILSSHQPVVVPYFRWLDVDDEYGTFVAMRLVGGEWLQEHRPTGRRVRVMSPHDFQLRHPDWNQGKWRTFDPARELSRTSPGVIRTPNPLFPVYLPYDPANVPDAVRASWGDEPLEPLSFGPDWTGEAAPLRPPKRRRL